MTAYGAYVNEASLANEVVFDEIKSRCSGYGARILVDTNPDHPEHWLRKDYLLNKDESILKYKFTIYDNTFLNKRYRDNIIATTPSGVFTKRNILGEWVSGDGVVYRDFDPSKHFIDDLTPYDFTRYIAGVDWGYSHYGVIVVIGVTADENYILLEEHAEQFKEIDYWVEVAQSIKRRYGQVKMYCDSARPEYVARFYEEGFDAYNANKQVLSGIETVASMYKQDKLKLYEPAVKRFRDEIYTYTWDKNGMPIKENDDVQDAIRYAIHSDREDKVVVQVGRHSL